MFLSSNPHSWPRPFFARLRQDSKFSFLSPSHQFHELCRGVEAEHPTKAAEMREWSSAAQAALLNQLATMVERKPAETEAELWRVHNGDRELRCVAAHLPTGIDLRLLEGDGFRRTRLCKIAPEVDRWSAEWQAALLGVGWSLSGSSA